MNPNVTRYPAEAIEQAVTEFSTPFFLYEEEQIRANCKRYADAFGPLFPNFTPLFAVKANSNPHVLKILIDEGWGFDCSSKSEVWLANEFDVLAQHTGNYCTDDELRYVLESQNTLLNVDDISMLDTIQGLGVPEYISFRINPGVSSATMESNLLAGPDAKYGLPWEEAIDAYKRAKEMGVQRFGIHMMTGSNVAEEDYFPGVTRKLLEIAGKVKEELGIDFEYINIGGGFNVPYEPDEPTFDLQKIAQDVRTVFDEECPKWNLTEPKLMIEPGRSVTCDAGFLVGSVTVIKDGYKKFVGINASCNAMPRPSIYGAYHHISVLGKDDGETESVNVVGSICENNDQFAMDRMLPQIDVGDTIVIHNCGAHAYTMGHNYNGKFRPAEYLLRSDGSFEQIRRAETTEDLFTTVSPWK